MQWEVIHNFFTSLSLLDYLVLTVNILMIIFAQPLLKRFSSGTTPESTLKFRTNLLRGLNFIIIIVYGYQYLYLPINGAGKGITLVSILVILYLTYLSNFLIQYFIHKRYGKRKEIGDKTLYIETYQTRLLSILSGILLSIIAVISIIHQLGFDSLLEAGGVLGVIGVMLGLTQASWAPDIISGLIILNSDMFEEGDIVELGEGMLGRVYKTKLFHTEILNISNNHRVMVRNAHLRDKVIQNLSKFASAKGLREGLCFNIGYDTPIEAIKQMFNEAFDAAVQQGVPFESQYPPEVKVQETGDHAVTWIILFYVKKVDQIIAIRRDFREVILRTADARGISLATPFTHFEIKGAQPGL